MKDIISDILACALASGSDVNLIDSIKEDYRKAFIKGEFNKTILEDLENLNVKGLNNLLEDILDGEYSIEDKIKAIDNTGLTWDFIGRLQKNKIKYIIKRVNLIHSIDTISLLEEVNEKACEIGRKVDVLIQVNVSHEETKTGFHVSELSDVFKVRADNINIRGLMTMAPLTDDESELRKYFRETFEVKNDINKKYNLNLDELSMGMSNDYKEALMEGATIVRIGSKLFE